MTCYENVKRRVKIDITEQENRPYVDLVIKRGTGLDKYREMLEKDDLHPQEVLLKMMNDNMLTIDEIIDTREELYLAKLLNDEYEKANFYIQ